tara:strand:+ start:56 stop:256 length:201 start_codon:yes stop_codon:yes gene_type:complete
MYFTFLKLYIENFLDYYFELPNFEIDDNDFEIDNNDFEQKEPPTNNIFSYKRNNDDDDEFIKVIMI